MNFRLILNKLLPNRVLAWKKCLGFFIKYSQKLGYYNSLLTNTPVSASFEPMPWYTYPAIEYLSQFDFSNFAIFEYGAGNSSIFWSKKCKKVVSVEDDENWYKQIIDKRLPSNEIIFRLEKDKYVNSIAESGQSYDIIIIDGKYRDECSAIAMKYLNKGGLIILDNSDRHQDLCKNFRNQGLLEIDFHGFGAINTYSWTTSIFFSELSNLKTITFQPVYSACSVEQK